eukprot:6600-Chlamydomonas_euryale.AAC.1
MSAGRALLLLTPSEKDGMLSALADAKVPIKQIRINPKKATSVGPALQSLLSKSVELKEFAQRSLVAYVRSVFLQPNKRSFSWEEGGADVCWLMGRASLGRKEGQTYASRRGGDSRRHICCVPGGSGGLWLRCWCGGSSAEMVAPRQ